MRRFPPVFDLVPDQVAQVIRLAGLAPSAHNSQPWRFRVLPHVIEVHADPARRSPTGPNDRELRLACGAALLNLRLALAHAGVRPVVTLLPRLSPPTLLAEVRSGGHQRPDAEQVALYEAIPNRRTHRRQFCSASVPFAQQQDLMRAARTENAWLHLVQPSERGTLEGLAHLAHLELAVCRFRADSTALTARAAFDDEPVPATEFEPDPLLAVLCTAGNSPKNDLQAGQAWQRVWLTATARGLVAATLPEIVAAPGIRDGLSRLLGDEAHPQALLRIGYGAPSPSAPRRDPAELLIDAVPTNDHS
ncbi:nitroreductase [Saccharopolyspora phatthalungensis]|uniref:Nitroreductase n=1 Tax=Saccharopolyspora phatthalungensis TaxID=664693 RepID=A0A840QCE5_9PSEU|nr:nitroreductase [Saccharopolyspora phatthalungensis]MBB5157637.1 nitroreductase [Saccharopolyspora phatthalungensis]